ncbi:hypothetical protein CR513_12141, partial [Mucuna pruriens]
MGRLPSLNIRQRKWRFFHVCGVGDDPNIFLDHFGQPFFPLFWAKDPTIAIRVERAYVEDWEEEFIIDLGSRLVSLIYLKAVSIVLYSK